MTTKHPGMKKGAKVSRLTNAQMFALTTWMVDNHPKYESIHTEDLLRHANSAMLFDVTDHNVTGAKKTSGLIWKNRKKIVRKPKEVQVAIDLEPAAAEKDAVARLDGCVVNIGARLRRLEKEESRVSNIDARLRYLEKERIKERIRVSAIDARLKHLEKELGVPSAIERAAGIKRID